jgi:hypothetical protein
MDNFKLSDSKKLEDASNYSSWKYFMELILTERDVFSIVDGKEPKPTNHNDESKWSKRDIKARMIIIINLRSYLVVHARDCKTAKELWDKMKSMFESLSMSQRMFLRIKLNMYMMVEGESIYFDLDRIKEIWDQLHYASDTISNEEMVPIALNGFSIDYGMFVSNVASREIVPSFEMLHDIFLSKEMRKKAKNQKD